MEIDADDLFRSSRGGKLMKSLAILLVCCCSTSASAALFNHEPLCGACRDLCVITVRVAKVRTVVEEDQPRNPNARISESDEITCVFELATITEGSKCHTDMADRQDRFSRGAQSFRYPRLTQGRTSQFGQ